MTSPLGAEPAGLLPSSFPFSPLKVVDPRPPSHSPPDPPEGTRNAQTAQRGRARDPPRSAGHRSGFTLRAAPHPQAVQGAGARAPPRTRPHARAFPPRSRPSPPGPGGGGAAGGLGGCDAPGAAAALLSGRSGAGCWERCSGGAAGTAASRERSARRGSCELSKRRARGRERCPPAAAAAAALFASSGRPRPCSHPPRAHLPAVPRARRSEAPAAAAAATAAAASLRGETCTRAAADRTTAAGCARGPRGPAAPSGGAEPPRASERSEVLGEPRRRRRAARSSETPGTGWTPRCSGPCRAAGKGPGGAGKGRSPQ